ncbi:hypothetical protein GAYE_SCF05G2565 [Galdieria yellowstonensis]|uniref:ADP-ribosylation factor n=1 Tax=Galdieria yellowstonensis TaxID=3028027 RepID=A0AAV9IBE8_9RHOD|nr:hypothetical protein GAYE_SCF05G2565 [Galdieria yellowstonensis]
MLSSIWEQLLAWLKSLFFEQEMELAVLGLQNAGKTTLVNLFATGTFTEDRIPTVGFNLRKVRKGGVTLKVWDLGGQQRFRSMWERYCRGVHVIVFVLDAADKDRFSTAKLELLEILQRPSLASIPLLFLANKSDLPDALVDPQEIIQTFDLKSIKDREVAVYSVSAKNRTNIDTVLRWLISHNKKPTNTTSHQVGSSNGLV